MDKRNKSIRRKTTEFLGRLLVSDRFGGIGNYWASEVNLDFGTRKNKRVDFMQFVPQGQCSISEIEKGIFVCYEIKSCKEDVYSGNGLNFLGEKNYIVTTMECYKELLPTLRDGTFEKHLREVNPDSSNHFGVMVAIPYMSNLTNEFENPTELDFERDRWRLAVINNCIPGLRNKSTTELLFCMLRSGR